MAKFKLLEVGQKPIPGHVYLLREHFTFDRNGICDINSPLLTEDEKRLISSDQGMFLTGVAQRADAKNGNQRVYPYRILEREIKNYKKVIENNLGYGELDHPEQTTVELKNACHRCVDIWWNGKDVYVKLKIHTSTDPGRNLAGHIKDGGGIGLSSRGLGSVKDIGGTLLVEDDFQLICFDIVSEPSTGGAFMHLMENKNNIPTTSSRINETLTNILYDMEER